MDMKGVTREEAVLFLLSLQEQIDLIVQHRRQEYDQIVASGRGDSFHIKLVIYSFCISIINLILKLKNNKKLKYSLNKLKLIIFFLF